MADVVIPTTGWIATTGTLSHWPTFNVPDEIVHNPTIAWSSIVADADLVDQAAGFTLSARVTLGSATPLVGFALANADHAFQVLIDTRKQQGSSADIHIRRDTSTVGSSVQTIVSNAGTAYNSTYHLTVSVVGTKLTVVLADEATNVVLADQTITVTIANFQDITRIGVAGHRDVTIQNLELRIPPYMIRASDQVTLAKTIDLAYTRPYFLLQSSTSSAPAKPTTNPPGGAWSASEPGYSGGTVTLYTVQLNVWSDGSFDYGDVQKSVAFEAAKQAYNAAIAAQFTADGKNKRYISPLTAPPNAEAQGDEWYVLRPGTNAVDEIRIWNGSVWAPYRLAADSIMVPSSVGAISLADGAVTAPKIAGKVITAEHVSAGAISVDELTPNIGSQLDISINPTVADVQDGLEQQQRRFRFDSNGLEIGDPATSEALRLTPGRVEMVQGGSVPTWWEAQNFYVERMIVKAANIGSHRFEGYANGRTVIRPLRGM